MIRLAIVVWLLCFVASCSETSPDWVVIQLDSFSQPARCWELRHAVIHDDTIRHGIYWQSASGNRVYLSAPHIRVQVVSGRWDDAFREAGTTQLSCRDSAKRFAE